MIVARPLRPKSWAAATGRREKNQDPENPSDPCSLARGLFERRLERTEGSKYVDTRVRVRIRPEGNLEESSEEEREEQHVDGSEAIGEYTRKDSTTSTYEENRQQRRSCERATGRTEEVGQDERDGRADGVGIEFGTVEGGVCRQEEVRNQVAKYANLIATSVVSAHPASMGRVYAQIYTT